MANLQTVKIPLLERVVLEELAIRWDVSTDEAIRRLIRQAAINHTLRDQTEKSAAPAVPAEVGHE